MTISELIQYLQHLDPQTELFTVDRGNMRRLKAYDLHMYWRGVCISPDPAYDAQYELKPLVDYIPKDTRP